MTKETPMTETTGAEAIRELELDVSMERGRYEIVLRRCRKAEVELRNLRDQHAKVMALLQPLLKAREKAAQGEWSNLFDDYDDDGNDIKRPDIAIQLGAHGFIYDEGRHTLEDAEFIALAANTCSKLAGVMGSGE